VGHFDQTTTGDILLLCQMFRQPEAGATFLDIRQPGPECQRCLEGNLHHRKSDNLSIKVFGQCQSHSHKRLHVLGIADRHQYAEFLSGEALHGLAE
jgi:hypothetical protein